MGAEDPCTELHPRRAPTVRRQSARVSASMVAPTIGANIAQVQVPACVDPIGQRTRTGVRDVQSVVQPGCGRKAHAAVPRRATEGPCTRRSVPGRRQRRPPQSAPDGQS